MWSYIDHKLKLRVKISKWRTETDKLSISEVISDIIILTMIRKTRLLPNDIRQSYLSSIVPTLIIERPNWIHHFSVSSVVCRHVESTVWFGWSFKEALPLRFSKCNDTLFYGQTLITNSNWEYSWVREAQRQTSCASQRYQWYNYDNNDNKNKTFAQWYSSEISFINCSHIPHRETKLNS